MTGKDYKAIATLIAYELPVLKSPGCQRFVQGLADYMTADAQQQLFDCSDPTEACNHEFDRDFFIKACYGE